MIPHYTPPQFEKALLVVGLAITFIALLLQDWVVLLFGLIGVLYMMYSIEERNK
jgi:hypothetical protein